MAYLLKEKVLDENKQIIWENTEKVFCFACGEDITEPIKQFGRTDMPLCQKHFLEGYEEEIQWRRNDFGYLVPVLLVGDAAKLAKLEDRLKALGDEREELEWELEGIESQISEVETAIDELKKKIADAKSKPEIK